MASIDKKNDSYRIRVSIGKDSEGKRLYETLLYTPKETTPSRIRKEVDKVAMEFEDKVRNGVYYTGDKITFSDYVPIWREQWAKDSLTTSGLEGYEILLRNRIIPSIGKLPIGSIRPTHIQNLITDMKNEGKAPKTIKKYITALNSVMKYAYDMEVIEDNPVNRVRLPKKASTDELHYFTVEQVQTFLEALERSYPCVRKGHTSKSPKTGETFEVKEYTQMTTIPFQWRVYFNLAVFGAFRRGELIAIQWKDIDWDNHTISIKRAFAKTKGGQEIKSPKTESGIRTITLPSSSMDLLSEWYTMEKELSLKLGSLWEGTRGKAFDSNYVFIQLGNGLPMCVSTPTSKFKEVLRMYNATCENEEDKLPEIRLHDLRHTSATLLLSNGTDIETVSHRLGHKHCSVTLDVYGHWLEDKDKSASDTLEQLFQKKA